MKVAVFGATGLVGRKMIQVLEERNFPAERIIAIASERSVGKNITYKGKNYTVMNALDGLKENPDIALFSAGGQASLKWAPEFAKRGITVIDNSSAWRMDENIPLVVPEINGDNITGKDKIIANPNCSTIQMVMVLAPLHNKFKIKRLVISTYQSVSGSGIKGIKQMADEREGKEGEKIYPHPIDKNTLPHAGDFEKNGYTTEEIKLVNETQKILNDKINITATAVRVPVSGGHSEAVNVEFYQPFEMQEVFNLLQNTSGVIVKDNPEKEIYPMPLDAYEKDDVFVGRIRRDFSIENGLNLWVVADNIRKGAATNAVQIAEYLLKNKLIH